MRTKSRGHLALYLMIIVLFLFCSVNAYPSMLVRLVFTLAMHVGNCTVLNMGSSPMVKYLAIKLPEVEVIHLTLSSVRQELVNMFPEQRSWTWSQL